VERARTLAAGRRMAQITAINSGYTYNYNYTDTMSRYTTNCIAARSTCGVSITPAVSLNAVPRLPTALNASPFVNA